MDIATVSMVLSQAKLQQSAGILVMKKGLDASKQNSNLITQMLDKVDQPVSAPHIGSKLDVYV